jgi:hypothetical protein
VTRKVGYGSPPDHSKWSKGQSGNPSGRKKGNRNFATDLADELATVVELNEGGRPIQVTKQQAFIKALIARSIKGDARAVAQLLKVVMQHGAEQPSDAAMPVDAEDEAIVAAFIARQLKKGEEA